MKIIKVNYDGSYPNACSGTLEIIVNDKIIYKENHCCHSTGSVWFDDDWSEHVEDGDLMWDDADEFDRDIQEAVKERLSKVQVCCGGCV